MNHKQTYPIYSIFLSVLFFFSSCGSPILEQSSRQIEEVFSSTLESYLPSSSENLNSIPETSSENFIINEPYFEKVFLTKENLQFLAKSDPLYKK